MRIAIIGIIFIAASVFCGCGAIVHGTRQDVTISTSPNEAQVLIQGEQKSTPAVFNLKRKHSYVVKVAKDGYESSDVIINNKLDWTAWCDLLVWGIVPIFYDLASGAAWKLSPEEISVTLNRSLGYKDGPESIRVDLTVDDDKLNVITPVEGMEITITQTK